MGCAKAYNRSENWQGIRQSVRGKMIPGQSYTISAWVRISGSTSDRVIASVEQQDGGGTQYYNIANVTANDSEWLEVSGDFTLSTEGTLTVLDVYFEGAEPGVDIYIDDVNVYGLMPVSSAPKAIVAKAKVPEPKGTGKIDANARRQMMEGFGAAGAHYTMEFVRHKRKSEFYNLLFRELDLDIFRIRNNYDMEPNSFKETVEIVKGGKAALAGDLKIMMTSWSPPAYLKSNNNTVGGTLKKSGNKYMYDEFANWWYKSLVAYSEAGVKVDYINIQNEPDFEASWDGCKLDPKESASVAGYGAAFEAVWQKLNKEMGSAMPKMLAPETSGLSNIINYIDNLADQSHIYGYAHHLYNCSGDGDSTAGCGSAPDRYLDSMEAFKSRYGNKPLFQTEYEHEPDTWTDAMNVAILMHNSLTVEEVTAYLYWDLFWGPASGLISMDDPDSYRIKPAYYAFKQFSAFIDSGFRRVGASSDNSNLRVSAYISPDGKKLTAVIINTTAATDIDFKLAIDNFSISKGDVYRSSETEKCIKVGSYDGTAPLKLPAYSVTTLSLSSGRL
jgi:glucuronoarabinoxylan endo-1,4-beta-xylanase